MNDYGRAKFRRFAEKNRLRIKIAEDGNPVVCSIGKKYKGCRLFEGFDNEHCGLYIMKDTPYKLTYLANQLQKMDLTQISRGDFEASFKVPYSKVMAIAKQLKMIKRTISAEHVVKLNKWRNK
jgi:hypothetical protein